MNVTVGGGGLNATGIERIGNVGGGQEERI